MKRIGFIFILCVLVLPFLSFATPVNATVVNLTNGDTRFEIINGQVANLYVENTMIGTFTAQMYITDNDSLIFNPFNFTFTNYTDNVTWDLTSLTYSGQKWIKKRDDGSPDGLKWGNHFTSLFPHNVSIRHQWYLTNGTTLTVDAENKLAYINNPNLTKAWVFNYQDLPEWGLPDEQGVWVNYTDVTEITIDPIIDNACNGNDDGANTECDANGADNLLTNTCNFDFRAFQTAANAFAVGSFDSIRDPNTTRRPFTVYVNSTENIATTGTNNTCRIVVLQTDSCSGTNLVDQTFTNDNVLLNQPNRFSFNQSTGWDGFAGEHCVKVTRVTDDGVTGVTTSTVTGRIVIATYLNNPTVSYPTINFFEDQVLNHNIQANESTDITNIKFTIINASNNALLEAETTDTSPDTAFTDDMVNFDTLPSSNQNITYNYTSITDNSHSYFRFSSSSLNSAGGFSPKPNSFNLSNYLNCSVISADKGVYNLRQTPVLSGVVMDVRGQPYNVSAAKADNIRYRLHGSTTDQVTSGAFDINTTGGWALSNRPLVAGIPAGFNLTGTPYDINFFSQGDAAPAEQQECTYPNVFNVSKLWQFSSVSSSVNNQDITAIALINRGKNQNETMFLFDASNVSVGTLTNDLTVQINDSASATIESTESNEDTVNGLFENIFAPTSNSLTDGLGFNTRQKNIHVCDSFGNCISSDGGATNGTGNAYNQSETLQGSSLSGSIDGNVLVNVTPKVYNRGESANISLFLSLANGTKHVGQSGISVDFKTATNTVQVTDSGESTDSNGFVDTNVIIPTTATVNSNNLDGDLYHISLTDTNNNSFSFNTTGFAAGAYNGSNPNNSFNVSKKYNTTEKFLQTTIFLGNRFNATSQLRNARNEILTGISLTLYITDPTSTTRYSTTDLTNSTGYVNTSNFVTQPTGTWSAKANLTNNGNTELDSPATVSVIDKAIEDPFQFQCSGANTVTGQTVYCSLHSRNADGSGVSGQTISYNVTRLPSTQVTSGTAVEMGTGEYFVNFTASAAGVYNVTANLTDPDTTPHRYFQFVTINDASGGGGGSLTADQNATLYLLVGLAQNLSRFEANSYANATTNNLAIVSTNQTLNFWGSLINVTVSNLNTTVLQNVTVNFTSLAAQVNATNAFITNGLLTVSQSRIQGDR